MALYEEDLEDEELDRGDTFEDDEEVEDEEIEGDEEVEDEEIEEEVEDEEIEEVKKEPRIPKSRLDEVIQQREDAKERNLWLEAQLEKLITQSNRQVDAVAPQIPESTYDFSAAEEQYVTLIIEGEIGKASKLRSEIDTQRKNELVGLIDSIKASSSQQAKLESTAILEEERFSNYILSIESKYSFLDTNSDDYNEEAVDTVNTLLAGYVAAGKTKTEGLKLAVGKVAPLYNKEVKEVTKTSLGGKRQVEAGKKAAKAASSQPTKVRSSSARSSDSDVVNVSKMSDRDFSKLTAKEKSILRGD